MCATVLVLSTGSVRAELARSLSVLYNDDVKVVVYSIMCLVLFTPPFECIHVQNIVNIVVVKTYILRPLVVKTKVYPSAAVVRGGVSALGEQGGTTCHTIKMY